MSNMHNTVPLTPESINERISAELCEETLSMLTDLSMTDDYKACESVKNEISKLDKILSKHNITNDQKDAIITDYLIELIPPGTKAVMRGNKFNRIINARITNMKLDPTRFEVAFEKECTVCETFERPDWYILDKKTGKVIIGMNQLDLWGGGHQHNRASKYLIDNKINTDKTKLLCVVCNKIKFKIQKNGDSPKTKAYKYFEIGFANDTLCYIKNVENIINNYFGLASNTTLLT